MVKNQDKPKAVQVNPEGHQVIDEFVGRFGVEKAQLVTRVLVWYGKQSPEVQRAILDPRGDAAAELVKLKLAEAQGGELPATLDEALAVARAAMDRVEYIAQIYKRELKERLEPPAKKK